MATKAHRKTPNTGRGAKSAARKTKTPKEISRELREQQAMDPARSGVEDYLAPDSQHFRS